MGRMAVCAVVVAMMGCGKSDDPRAYRAAYERFEPSLQRLVAIRDALPAPGTEQEKACGVAIPKEGLEASDLLALEYFLGKDLDEKIWRNNLQSMFSYRPDRGPSRISGRPGGPNDVQQRGVINMERDAEDWASVKHVLIFRASETDLGKFGGKDASGTLLIERPARWRGWAFVYTFQDPPALVTAFPFEGVSDDHMAITLYGGDVPSHTELIERVAMDLRTQVFERLARCPVVNEAAR